MSVIMDTVELDQRSLSGAFDMVVTVVRNALTREIPCTLCNSST
jgi:hypothetical protein